MSLSMEEQKALTQFRDRLTEEFGAKTLYLFGSKAQGTDTPDSDVDVAVILGETSPELESKMDDLAFDINMDHGCLVAPLYFSEREIVDGPMSESPIYKRILREGIKL